jgi:rhodanese-related sulfurtransferase
MSVSSKLLGTSTSLAVGPTEAQDLWRHGAVLVVVGRSGNGSARATRLLTKADSDAVNPTDGMTASNAAGLPLVNRRGKRGTGT